VKTNVKRGVEKPQHILGESSATRWDSMKPISIPPDADHCSGINPSILERTAGVDL